MDLSILAVTGISLTTALGVCLAWERGSLARIRRLEGELKTIRSEWENAWSLIDSAAKRAARHEKIRETRQDAPGGSNSSPQDLQAARIRILAAAKRGGE